MGAMRSGILQTFFVSHDQLRWLTMVITLQMTHQIPRTKETKIVSMALILGGIILMMIPILILVIW